MHGQCECHERHDFHGPEGRFCHHWHEESKDVKLARLKAWLLVLQAREREVEKMIKHLEECQNECKQE